MLAASSGSPKRRIVYDRSIRFANSSFEVAAAIAGVRVAPSAMQLAVIENRPTAFATARMNPAAPAFAPE